MKIEIYINGKSAKEYTQKEMEEIKKTLTEKAIKAAGYILAN